jgi:hypothetical protein
VDNIFISFTLDCAYSLRKPLEPLLALPLTAEITNGSVSFTHTSDHQTLVVCGEDVKVGKWQYLNAFGRWVDGEGGAFSVSSISIGGPARNRRVLKKLEVLKQCSVGS